MDLEIFLEREKSLELEIERLGKTAGQIQGDIEHNRGEVLNEPTNPSTWSD